MHQLAVMQSRAQSNEETRQALVRLALTEQTEAHKAQAALTAFVADAQRNLDRVVGEVTARADQLHALAERRLLQVQTLQETCSAQSLSLDKAQDACAQLRKELEHCRTQEDRSQQELSILRAAEAHLEEALRLRAAQHDELLRRHQRTQEDLLREVRQLQTHRDELEAILLASYASESWRLGRALTAPVRALKAGLQRRHRG